jgi:hypothetical protein
MPRRLLTHSAPVSSLLVLLAAGCGPDAVPSAPAGAHAASLHRAAQPPSAALQKQLAALRSTTAPFHNFEKASAAGYGVRITPCWYHRSLGAQGYHYGDPTLIDGTVELLRPELLMYEPRRDGSLRLVGIEYIVPVDAWAQPTPPTLLGQTFHHNQALGIYALHVWLWRDNPAGLFADWNPRVSCEHADEADDRA